MTTILLAMDGLGSLCSAAILVMLDDPGVDIYFIAAYRNGFTVFGLCRNCLLLLWLIKKTLRQAGPDAPFSGFCDVVALQFASSDQRSALWVLV